MICVNKKNGQEYKRFGYCINKTNKQDGERMVLYRDKNGQLYAREEKEFNEKFKTKFY